MWRTRRWRYLLSRIDHLPRNSAYVEAVSQDEELAKETLRNPPEKKSEAMRMRDWSPELEALATAVDRIGDVVQATIAAQGGKPPKIRPFPRPKTAVDRLQDPRRIHHQNLSMIMIEQEDGSLLSAAEAG